MILTLLIISWAVIGVISFIYIQKIFNADVCLMHFYLGILAGGVCFIVLLFIWLESKYKDKPIIKFKK